MGGGGEDGSEGSIVQCTFALIKMTSELDMYIMKQQAGVSGRKNTSRKGSFLSNQATAVYDTQRRAVRQTLLKLD